jgi:hypothetical protein
LAAISMSSWSIFDSALNIASAAALARSRASWISRAARSASDPA